MIIYVVRHAWAGKSGDPRYPDDALRPLTEKGRRRFRRMVAKLVKRGFNPMAVATSSLVRARQTAKLIAARGPGRPSITLLDDLAPGGRLAPLVEWSREKAPADVAWVGHAPDIERLTAELIGAGDGRIHLDKGAVAAVRFTGHPAAGEGELIWLATAELLRL
ncbi:MAG: histidine phosphatase family protein [Planctomycetia bacterium]|nr:histidine phosphatase family protein [Planctomycetia bacterium]